MIRVLRIGEHCAVAIIGLGGVLGGLILGHYKYWYLSLLVLVITGFSALLYAGNRRRQ